MNSKFLKRLAITSITAVVALSPPLSAAAEWKQDSNGWRNEEGSTQSIGWNNIGGVWYYFNQNGYMQTGWIKDGEIWYYASGTGAMQTGVVEVNGEIYYLNPSGAMQTGTVIINNKTYNFDLSGKNMDSSKPAPGKKFDAANQEKVEHAKSTHSSRSGGSGGGGGGGSSSETEQPDPVEAIEIEDIVSVENGILEVTLSKPTTSPLPLSAFGIYCPAFGQMTILKVENGAGNETNQVYTLKTPYYKDQIYTLTIDIPDGPSLEREFEIRYNCPDLGVPYIKRTSDTTADFIYQSDAEGTFFYLLKKQQSEARSAYSADTPTSEEIIRSGIATDMQVNENIIALDNLEKDAPYVIYYAARDIDGYTTPGQSAVINSKVDIELSEIKIETLQLNFKTGDTIFDARYWFSFQLSEPTGKTLDITQFSVTCPKGDISLDYVETTDNLNYDVYVESGSMLMETRFIGKIDFGNGETAEKIALSDLQEPKVQGLIEITRLSETKVKVEVRYTEPGTVYFKILDYVSNDVSVKDPKEIYEAGDTQEIYYGTNFIEIDSDEIATDKWVAFAAEDDIGNRAYNFDYVKIPPYNPVEDIPEEETKYSIVDAQAVKHHSEHYNSVIVTFNQKVNMSSVKVKEITGTNMKVRYDVQGLKEENQVQIDLNYGDKNVSIAPGRRIIFLSIYHGNEKYEYLEFEFTVEEDSSVLETPEILEQEKSKNDDIIEEDVSSDETPEAEEPVEPGDKAETAKPEEQPEAEDAIKPEGNQEPEDIEQSEDIIKPKEHPEAEDALKPEENQEPEDIEQSEGQPETEYTTKPEENQEPEAQPETGNVIKPEIDSTEALIETTL